MLSTSTAAGLVEVTIPAAFDAPDSTP